MVKLILVRPGRTDYDLQGRIQGTLDIPLSNEGRKEAAALAVQLKSHAPFTLFASPGEPAEETALIIGQNLETRSKRLDRLTNINLGLWQGMLTEEVRHKQPKVYKQWQEHPEMVRPPSGETISDVFTRIDECLEKLVRKFRATTVVLVVPEPLKSLIRHRVDGSEIGDLWCTARGAPIDVITLDSDFVAAAADRAKSSGKTDIQSVYIYRGSIVDRR